MSGNVQDKSEKPTATGMTSIAQLHIRLVNVFRAQALDGLDTSTDPYLRLLDSYSNEIKRSCREVSRADNKQMAKDLWRWDRATTENEQKLRFCFDLQSAMHAKREDEKRRARKILVTVVLFLSLSFLIFIYTRLSL